MAKYVYNRGKLILNNLSILQINEDLTPLYSYSLIEHYGIDVISKGQCKGYSTWMIKNGTKMETMPKREQ